MRLLQLLTLAFVCLVTAVPFSADSGNIEDAVTESNDLHKRATFPSVSGLKFNINGSTAYFAGTNSYWIGFLTNNADVDTVMTHLKSSGLKVLRVWGTSLHPPLLPQTKLSRFQRHHEVHIRSLVPEFHLRAATPN
jgi:mannan endo-1,4-beta-mannosidase